jgi:hypothetical protein
MRKLLLLVLLAPLFIGAAPPDQPQNTFEFWGGGGRYVHSGCDHTMDVKYYEAAVSLKHRTMTTTSCIIDSGKVKYQKALSPYSVIIEASALQGTANEISKPAYSLDVSPPTDNVEYYQLGFKVEADWQAFGMGLGGGASAGGYDSEDNQDSNGFGLYPAVRLRLGERDKLYVSGELFYSSPLRSGHGGLAAGLGHEGKSLELWAGGALMPDDDKYRPALTVKYRFNGMMAGLNASYSTVEQHGINPYAFSLGVG